MNFRINPKIGGSMKKIHLSPLAGMPLIEYLKQKGFEICFTQALASVAEPVAHHPDLLLCKLGIDDKAPVFHGDVSRLGPAYPADIPYNACCTGRYFIHNLKYTAPELLAASKQAAQHRKKPLLRVSVPQGYTKCNIVCVDEESIITSDAGIEKACSSAGMSVLKIRPGQVLLPGYAYGFLGGTSGRIGDKIVFNGDLSAHPDFNVISAFIESRGLSCVYFKDYPLTDIGSIIVEPDSDGGSVTSDF